MEILFFTEKVDLVIENPDLLREWLTKVAGDNHFKVGEISFVFTDDNSLLKINREFLNHDYLTDIITFDNRQGNELNSDIYISADRIKENAQKYSRSFMEELHRVMVHGILHLCGYKDDSPSNKEAMRLAENKYLSLLADL
jgi:rRNA maturation RNase YbeY